jgi:hypothetical protein
MSHHFNPTDRRYKHGMSNTPEYSRWHGMKGRCCNKNDRSYHYYGGRGIKICDRWRNDFLAFLADMGPCPSPRHSIGRINNDGDYEPDNCRWETPTQQNRNTRHNRWITAYGETHMLWQWSEFYGIPILTILNRLRIGWSNEDAVFLPVIQGIHLKNRRR